MLNFTRVFMKKSVGLNIPFNINLEKLALHFPDTIFFEDIEKRKVLQEQRHEKIKEQKRAWAKRNREKLNEYQRQYYSEHSDECKKILQKYRDTHREEINRAERERYSRKNKLKNSKKGAN